MVCGMNKKNELVMGASLAVKLANLWLEEHEFTLLKDVPNVTVFNEDNKEVCPGSQKKVTYRTLG